MPTYTSPTGFFFRSACRACYACYADSNIRNLCFSESICHFKSGFITHCTVFFQRFALDTEIFHLRRICVSHKAFIQNLRRTRPENICYKCRKSPPVQLSAAETVIFLSASIFTTFSFKPFYFRFHINHPSPYYLGYTSIFSTPAKAASISVSTSSLLSDFSIFTRFRICCGCFVVNAVQQSSYGKIDVSNVPISCALSTISILSIPISGCNTGISTAEFVTSSAAKSLACNLSDALARQSANDLCLRANLSAIRIINLRITSVKCSSGHFSAICNCISVNGTIYKLILMYIVRLCLQAQ